MLCDCDCEGAENITMAAAPAAFVKSSSLSFDAVSEKVGGMASRIKILESLLRQVEAQSCLAVEDAGRKRDSVLQKEIVLRTASEALLRGALSVAEQENIQAMQHREEMIIMMRESKREVDNVKASAEKICDEISSQALEMEAIRKNNVTLMTTIDQLKGERDEVYLKAQTTENNEFVALERASVLETILEREDKKRQDVESKAQVLEKKLEFLQKGKSEVYDIDDNIQYIDEIRVLKETLDTERSRFQDEIRELNLKYSAQMSGDAPTSQRSINIQHEKSFLSLLLYFIMNGISFFIGMILVLYALQWIVDNNSILTREAHIQTHILKLSLLPT